MSFKGVRASTYIRLLGEQRPIETDQKIANYKRGEQDIKEIDCVSWQGGKRTKCTSCLVNQYHQRAQSGLLELVFKWLQNEFWLASHPGTEDGFRSERSRQSREEKTEEVNAELQNSFIRHATDVMQNTRETMRGKSQRQETQSHLPLLENNSSFNCASSELYQNLTF